MPDYYEKLGLSKGASLEEIKKAYRTLAKKHHPDLNRGDKASEEKFKEINEAYKVLSDPKTKDHYDRFGNNDSQGSSGFRGFDQGGYQDFDLGDIFSSFFGGGGSRRPTSRRGRNIQIEVSISLEDVAEGITKVISLNRNSTCDRCHGTGGEPDGIQSCTICGGSGVVQTTRRTPFGIFATNAPCRRCGGTGKIIVKPCEKCKGKGKTRIEEEIEVDLPAGVESGNRLRVPGKGEAGERGGPAGDLFVYINVLPHNFFERQGMDLLCEKPINFVTAAIGGKITIPTINGEAELKIPTGTQDGSLFKLRGQGLRRVHGGGRGDQLITISIKIPKKLNRNQKNILIDLERSFKS